MSDDLVKRLQDFPTGIYTTSERALRDEIASRIAALEAERDRLTAGTVMLVTDRDEYKALAVSLRARIAALEAELASGSFYKESDIDALMADRDKTKELRRALEIMLHAVCGETGFASAVRQDSGFAYPWPALDEAERIARAALGAGQ